ncbi:serine hydrolase domain-containing protein [Hydrogenophaga sp.]|uniref:serine hydrolase domain-containing protein n=1 Tax=Hydrogenophaga sp. TaxID=1904254 RepID=UPI00260644A2|nr:serine hydrolase domain-containing protein [Hydrogenophaga sp.]MCW5654288.1 beta-lactamase family protein [Hydrogenophaga sp.]
MHGLPVAAPADVGLCPERTQRIVQMLQRDVDRGRLPGAAVLIARRGRVVLDAAVGRLDPAREAPMGTDAIFRIYSMTKPIVSVAAMMLVEQGRLLLSDPVGQYVPGFLHQQVAVPGDGPNGVTLVPAARPATVQDLLRHTAGLTYEFTGNGYVNQRYTQADLNDRQQTNAQLCERLAALPLAHQPGTTWAYSRATDVLGRVIEVVTGQALGAFLREAILQPLGMHETAFSVPPAQHHRIAEAFSHDPDGGTPMPMHDPREVPALEMGGGGLMSTAHDYARFLQCLCNGAALEGRRLLSPHTLAYMTADHLGSAIAHTDNPLLPPGHGFGLGFAVRTETGVAPVPGSVGTYHWSGIGGTHFFVDPALDLFAIFMAQAPNQRVHYRSVMRGLVYGAVVD